MMFELASIGMAQADPHTGRWLRVNERFCASRATPPTSCCKCGSPRSLIPTTAGATGKPSPRVVRGKVTDYRLEKRYLHKNGNVAWVNVIMTVLCDAAGRPVRTMAAIEDITKTS